MRTPNTFQIGSTTYTTREYCHARGITDNATILKIQWRINTYIRNHTIQQTIEELNRLTLRQEGIRPWQGTKKEREITQQQKAYLLQQSKWMEHEKNLPKTSTPPKIEETNITDAPDRLHAAYRSLKLYADAQKEVEKWSINAAALLRDV